MKIFIHSFAQPLENWPPTHLLCLSISLAICLFGLCTHWIHRYLPNPTQANAILAELTQKVDTAQKTVANLPTLKKQVQTLEAQYRTEEQALEEANLLHHIEREASANTLQLDTFEPQPVIMDAHGPERSVRIRLSGMFQNIVRYVKQLEESDLSIAPIEAQLHLQNGMLILDSTLRITGLQKPQAIALNRNSHQAPLRNLDTHNALPAASAAQPETTRAKPLYNPFSDETRHLPKTLPISVTSTLQSFSLKLLGLFDSPTSGAMRKAAWIQAPNSSMLIYEGDCLEWQQTEGTTVASVSKQACRHLFRTPLLAGQEYQEGHFQEKVLHIRPRSISLLSPDGIRILNFEEAK